MPNIFSLHGQKLVPTKESQTASSTMAEGKSANNCLYQNTPHGCNTTNLTGEQALQMEAVRQGQGELALLIPAKNPIKAAQHYTGLCNANLNASIERKIVYEKHTLQQAMKEEEHKLHMFQEQEKGLERPPQPAFIMIEDDRQKK